MPQLSAETPLYLWIPSQAGRFCNIDSTPLDDHRVV